MTPALWAVVNFLAMLAAFIAAVALYTVYGLVALIIVTAVSFLFGGFAMIILYTEETL